MNKNFKKITQTSSRDIERDKDTIDTPTEAIDKDLQKEFKRVFEEILTEELMQRTKQNQEKIKNEIIDFVKKYSNGDYLELPYYLVLKARRAGLGNLERQFLKWNNNELEMVTLPTETSNNPLGAKINYVTKVREEYTNEEQIYINRVEDAQKKLADLFNFQGGLLWKGEESDLDIPREVKGLISDKNKEWNDFKERVLLYSPDAVSSIQGQYNQFAEYFENLYRGMLLALTTYKISNDIDSYSLFQQAESHGNSSYFGNNGEIKTDSDIDFFKDKDIRKFYDEQIEKQKVHYTLPNGENKEGTIKELRQSEDNDEREIAKRASNLIIMIILEQGILNKSSSGEITGINIGGNWKDSDLIEGVKKLKHETESIITDRLKNIKGKVLIDKSKIQTNEQKILPLTKEESGTAEETINIQNIIEDTAKNIERQNERGNIVYDPEKKTIKSRGNEIKIEVSERDDQLKKGKKIICKLDGLSEELDIGEGLRLANFRNWAKKKYRGKKIEYGYGSHQILFARKTLIQGRTRIIAKETLEKKLTSFNSDKGFEKIAEWLTKQIA